MEQLQNFAKARSSSFITATSNKDDLPPPGSFLDSGENAKEGWLSILSKKKWERRYFILKRGSSMLNFYKSAKDRTKGKIIQLFLSSCNQTNIKGQKYTFQLISRAENFTLKAESIEDMNSWIMIIQDTCAGLLSAGLDNHPDDFEHYQSSARNEDEDEFDPPSSIDNYNQINEKDKEKDNNNNNNNNNNKDNIKDNKENAKENRESIHPASNISSPSHLSSHPLSVTVDEGRVKSRIGLPGSHQSIYRRQPPTDISPASKKRPVTIAELLKRSNHCCDCNTELNEGNSFVSLLLGSFICRDCASIHHSLLGNQSSEIRSLFLEKDKSPTDLDYPLFDQTADPMAMTFLGFMGNKKVNDYWEATIAEKNAVKPNPSSSIEEKKYWISAKYIKKSFKGLKQGYLFIKSTDKKKFKRFWVVLSDSSLSIYRNQTDTKEEELIQLQSCGVKVGDDPTEPECFSVITPGKRYKIQAVTFPAALEWANAVRVAAATLVQALAASNAATPSKSASKVLSKSGVRRASRMMASPIQTDTRNSMQLNRDPTDWIKLNTEFLLFEEQLQTQDNEIIEMEARISRSKEVVKELMEDRYERVKEILKKTANSPAQLPKYIRATRSPIIIAANIDGLLHELLFSNDEQFRVEFILTYRSFLSTPHLLTELAEYYNRADSPPDTKEKVNEFIERWIKFHYYDIDEDFDAVRHISSFIDHPIASSGLFHDKSIELKSLLRHQILSGMQREKMIFDTTPISIDPKKSNFLFMDLDDLEVARQLTLIDHDLFSSIKPREFLNRGWLKEEKGEGFDENENTSPNIRKILNQFEERVNWVLTTILQHDRKKRSEMLCKFIQIAKHCVTLRNFNATLQIITAIEDNLLIRFHGTLEGINQKVIPHLLELRKLASKSDNYSNVKSEIYCKTSACIPFLTPFLDEILSIENENSDHLKDIKTSSSAPYGQPPKPKSNLSKSVNFSAINSNLKDTKQNNNNVIINNNNNNNKHMSIMKKEEKGELLIHFEKRRKLSKVIVEIQRYQVQPYNLRTIHSIQQFILNSHSLNRQELMNLAYINQLRELESKDGPLGTVPLPPTLLPPGLAPKPILSS